MVTFVCSSCNTSLKKNQVAIHRCCGSYSCVTCNGVFNKTTYKTHDRCITEAEKYQGSDYKAKVNKGEAKQESWIEAVTEALNQFKTSDPKLKSVINSVLSKPNIPQKESKFKNFIKSIPCSKSSIGCDCILWNVIAAKKTAIKAAFVEAAQPKEEVIQEKESVIPVEVAEVEPESKKEKKSKKTKKPVAESDLIEMMEVSEIKEDSKKDKKKKKKNVDEVEIEEVNKEVEVVIKEKVESIEGKKKKEKKEKKDVAVKEETVEVENKVEPAVEGKKKKEKKKEILVVEEKTVEAENTVESVVEGKKKKEKKKTGVVEEKTVEAEKVEPVAEEKKKKKKRGADGDEEVSKKSKKAKRED